MSNKTETKTLVPKCRFPEFKDEPEWQQSRLGDICIMQAGKFISASKIHDKYTNGLYPCFGGNGLRGYTQTYTHNGKYPLIGRQGALCGNINLAEGLFYATEHALVTTTMKGINVDWLFYELLRLNLNQHATGQAQPGLSVDVLEKVISFTPNNPDEQQKIADCLSSIDDVIAAQGKKVEALKDHKKGLMQKLFPTHGKTTPAFRFPEFRNDPEWALHPIGKKINFFSGYPFEGADISEKVEGVRLLRGINITEGKIRHSADIDRYFSKNAEHLEKYKVQINDLVIGMDGSKVGKNCALISEEDAGDLLVQRVARLRADNEILIRFIYQHINSNKFHSYVDKINTSSGIPHISAKQINDFEIFFPEFREQKMIVECMSSIDAIITAETQKFETLKNHKKGLMQQLFPTSNESEN